MGPMLAMAGANVAGSLINSASAARQNRKSREFQEKMFHMTNTYNSPIEQRKRLEAAGLNPNLVYGGSSGGTAGTASQPAKPDFNIPEWGNALTSGVQGGIDYYNVKAIQAGTDVNEARTAQIKQETVNAGIDSVLKTIKAAGGALDYKTKAALFNNTIALEQEKLSNLSQNTLYQQSKTRNEALITGATVEKMQAEINNLRKQGQILTHEEVMKKLDRNLYQEWGLRPDDPFYYKIIGRIMEQLDLGNPLKNVKQ